MGPCLLRFFIDMVWGAGIILHCAVSTSLPRASRAQASAQTGQKEALPRPPHSQASAQTGQKATLHRCPNRPVTTFRNPACNPKRDKGRQGKVISTCHGRQRETKQNHLSPASEHPDTMGDKGSKERQRETKQNHLSPASRHAVGDKGRQIISAQRPDTPWETRGDEGRQSKIISAQPPDMPREGRQSKIISAPSVQTRHGRQGETRRNEAKRTHASIQTRHGRQGETKGDKSAQHPSIQTHHGRQGEAKGDKGKQNKIISAQHPDTPWKTRGDKGWEASWPQGIEDPSQQRCFVNNLHTFRSPKKLSAQTDLNETAKKNEKSGPRAPRAQASTQTGQKETLHSDRCPSSPVTAFRKPAAQKA